MKRQRSKNGIKLTFALCACGAVWMFVCVCVSEHTHDRAELLKWDWSIGSSWAGKKGRLSLIPTCSVFSFWQMQTGLPSVCDIWERNREFSHVFILIVYPTCKLVMCVMFQILVQVLTAWPVFKSLLLSLQRDKRIWGKCFLLPAHPENSSFSAFSTLFNRKSNLLFDCLWMFQAIHFDYPLTYNPTKGTPTLLITEWVIKCVKTFEWIQPLGRTLKWTLQDMVTILVSNVPKMKTLNCTRCFSLHRCHSVRKTRCADFLMKSCYWHYFISF